MPVLMVYGVPNDTGMDKIAYLCGDLRMATAKTKGLNLTAGQVSCILPSDLKSPTGEEIIIFVKGLFKTPERTPKVLKNLSARLVNTARTFFPEAYLIGCFIESVSTDESGFSSFERLKP